MNCLQFFIFYILYRPYVQWLLPDRWVLVTSYWPDLNFTASAKLRFSELLRLPVAGAVTEYYCRAATTVHHLVAASSFIRFPPNESFINADCRPICTDVHGSLLAAVAIADQITLTLSSFSSNVRRDGFEDSIIRGQGQGQWSKKTSRLNSTQHIF